MIMDSKRLFVGNLPPGVSESDLISEFNSYGNVQKVELKFKENLVDPTNPSFFAFIVLDANDRQINQCIDEFSKEQYRGRYLTVSVARESFLDRLKREREENSRKNLSKEENFQQTNKSDEIKIVKKLPTLIKVSKKPASSSSSSETESESSSSSESDSKQFNRPNQNDKKIEEPEEFIAKKRASNSIQNGKIKIQTNLPRDPIHIIHKKEKTIQNSLDDKGKIADKKRKESMYKMKDQYTKQKLAIQQALAAVDSNKSRKICFDDGDDDVLKNDELKSINTSKKIDLFNDDEDDLNNYENDFAVKEQFQGEKGQKLMKLQSKFQLDPRFKMDKKFMDVDDDEDKYNKSITNDIPIIENEDDERKWQLGIIEQVVGHKFESLSEVNRKKIHKTMLRYDPTKQEHDKFLKNIEKVTKNIKATNMSSTAIDHIENNNESIDINEVSKEQFFKINDDLTNSLKRRGDGFSLLSMFGRPEEKNDNENQQNDNNEKILLSSKPNNQSNPFKFDSSDSENDDELSELTKTNLNKSELSENHISKGGKTTKSGIWTENFFITSDDPRLIDGAEFFKSIKRNNDNEPKEDYDKVKSKLKNIINKKISKTRKNLKINNKLIKKRNFKNRK